jgi:3-phenylpropionate/trans-cinnamate dioxygenase ferredoxin component
MSEGIRVAAVHDIAEGEGIVIARSITGTDDDVALLRDDDGCVWALDNTCTHAEASLAEMWVEDGQVECPLHSSKFCLKTGAVDGCNRRLGRVDAINTCRVSAGRFAYFRVASTAQI